MSTQAVSSLNNTGALNDYLAKQKTTKAADAEKANSTSTASAFSSLAGNQKTFLSILTTQLKNQDPTAATDTNQFTQELVQFTQAEQQINTNAKLDQLIKLQQNSNGLASTLGYIGKYVEAATTSQIALQKGDAGLAYVLPSQAKTVAISITDSNGKVINTISGPTSSGLNRINWDGKDSTGKVVADGTYNFTLSAKNASGNNLDVKDTRAVALVSALQTNSDGTTDLSFGDGFKVNSTKVSAVFDPNNVPKATVADKAAGS